MAPMSLPSSNGLATYLTQIYIERRTSLDKGKPVERLSAQSYGSLLPRCTSAGSQDRRAAEGPRRSKMASAYNRLKEEKDEQAED